MTHYLTRRRHLCRFKLLVLCLTFFRPANGQSDGYVTNSNLRGVVPFGTYQFGDIDSINLGTGGVDVSIPLFSRKGRGLDDGRAVTYSSRIWVPRPIQDAFNPERTEGFRWDVTTISSAELRALQDGFLDWKENYYMCPNHIDYILTRSNFIYTSALGGTHRFPNRTYFSTAGNSCGTAVSTSHYPVAASDSGVMDLDTS